MPVILGNHESATMNQMYGFDGEVKAKYSTQMAELFTEVYNWLPLAHCLNNRVLVSLWIYFHFKCVFNRAYVKGLNCASLIEDHKIASECYPLLPYFYHSILLLSI